VRLLREKVRLLRCDAREIKANMNAATFGD
jgi:hypothetical protein